MLWCLGVGLPRFAERGAIQSQPGCRSPFSSRGYHLVYRKRDALFAWHACVLDDVVRWPWKEKAKRGRCIHPNSFCFLWWLLALCLDFCGSRILPVLETFPSPKEDTFELHFELFWAAFTDDLLNLCCQIFWKTFNIISKISNTHSTQNVFIFSTLIYTDTKI